MENEARARSLLSLRGLSVGDAFGARCFAGEHKALHYPGDDKVLLRSGPWSWTDDTAMSAVLVGHLIENGVVSQDVLATEFAETYQQEPRRGYGHGARKLLDQLSRGQAWREASPALFNGQGSFGNGAAMRVAPLGAWFANDLDELVRQAIASAEVTHTHPEGIAGAITIAVAAASAWLDRNLTLGLSRTRLFERVLDLVPKSETRSKIIAASGLEFDLPIGHACTALDTRLGATAVETVPLTVWSAARHLRTFAEGLWRTAAAGGDHDTTCAMVGGIVALSVGEEGIPTEWLERTESLPSIHLS